MINAKAAKELYDKSGAEVDAYLKNNLEKAVMDAAKAGSRSLFHFLGSEEVFKNVTPTPIQKQIMNKLIELGYTVKFSSKDGDVYVPRGLADDNGKGPLYQNYGLEIGW